MSTIDHIKELIQYRGLLYMLAWKEVHVKYKQSIMGILWAILMPMMIVAAGVLVKYALAVASENPLDPRQIATVSVKAIPWSFLVASIRFSTNSLITNRNLVTKIYFPKEILPFASVLSQLADFMVAGATFAILLGLAGIGASVELLWLPLLAVVLLVLAAGIGLLTSAGALFFRDVKYLVEVGLTFAIFFTPVFFEVDLFPGLETYFLLNPATPILEGVNRVVVRHESPDVGWLIYSGFSATLFFVGAYLLFKRAEPKFAESI